MPKATLHRRLDHLDHQLGNLNQRFSQLETLIQKGFVTLATKAEMKAEITKAIDELGRMVKEGFDDADLRFEKIDVRFEKIDERFEQIYVRFNQIDYRFDQVDARFDNVDRDLGSANRRLDQAVYRADFTALASRVTTIERHPGQTQ